MKKRFGFVMAIAALVMLLWSSGSVLAHTVTGAYTITGDFVTIPCSVTSSTEGDLWTLLQGTCGGFGKGSENNAEGFYVLVTAKDGSTALYSAGELDPKFAPTNAVTLTCDKKGCDLAGEGRTVQNVDNIDVVRAVPVIKGGLYRFSTYFIVSGAGITPQTYNLGDLQGMPQATYTNTSSATWTGPTLLSLLKTQGFDTRDMDSYVVVQATDGYATVLSMYEATHKTGTQYDLMSISANDGELNQGPWSGGTKNDNGLARLIVPGDKGAGRWVSNVDQIVVFKLAACAGWEHWPEWR